MSALGNTVLISARSRSDAAPAKPRSRPERARYNGRSREARLVRLQEAELKAALGDVPVTPIMAAAIKRAAELSVIAADLRAKRLRGAPVDTAEIVKAENAHRRAVADLGIKPSSNREPEERHELADWLRSTKRGPP
jgi:hypothetical protein